jgi:hypothetical protein
MIVFQIACGYQGAKKGTGKARHSPAVPVLVTRIEEKINRKVRNQYFQSFRYCGNYVNVNQFDKSKHQITR